MREAIIEKLDDHLARGINNEADSVYLLVQIRKLLDHENSSRYPQLRFYGNWVAHINLSNKQSALMEYLRRIDDAISAQENNQQNFDGLITDAMSLDRLRDEMTTFFEERNINYQMLEVPQWRKFIKLLLGILADTPLVAPKHGQFRSIKEFTFTPGQEKTDIAGFKILRTNKQPIFGRVNIR